MDYRRVTLVAGVVGMFAAGMSASEAFGQWAQWGGPNRNFAVVDSVKLADSWPEDGPPQRWRQELGDGYSTILVDDGVLYTMYREEQDEFTAALNAETGAIIWEHKYPSPTTPNMDTYGAGPHSTPLIVGERLYSVGTNLALHCFDKKTGEVLWMLDLLKEYGGETPGYGYACSPIAYKDTIILTLGAPRIYEPPLAAFKQATGELVWKNSPVQLLGTRNGGYASPLLITLDGEDQVVMCGGELVSGYDPGAGKILWVHQCQDGQGVKCSTPVWDGGYQLFTSAAYASRARLIKLNRGDGGTFPEEMWNSRKMRVQHGTIVLAGDTVYGSSGDFGAAFLCAMDLNTGKPAWRSRDFAKANVLLADGKLIVLDENGVLALAEATPEEFRLLAKHKVAERIAWTAPTLANGMLYVRDRKHVVAINLKS